MKQYLFLTAYPPPLTPFFSFPCCILSILFISLSVSLRMHTYGNSPYSQSARAAQNLSRFKTPGTVLRDAACNVCCGFLFLFIGIALLVYNEHSLAVNLNSLEEVRGVVKSVPQLYQRGTSAYATHFPDGAVVHVFGHVKGGVAQDPQLGVSESDAVYMKRYVEAYQWRERSRENVDVNVVGLDGKYSYSADWYDTIKQQSEFHNPARAHPPNPSRLMFDADTFFPNNSRRVTFGPFLMQEDLWSQLGKARTVRFGPSNQQPTRLPARFHTEGKYVYYRQYPYIDTVGDHRISYQVIPSQDVSVIAQVQKGTLGPYYSNSGAEVAILGSGRMSIDALLAQRQSENVVMAWMLRGAGFLCELVAFLMILSPFSDVFHLIPCFGWIIADLVSIGTGIISVAFAFIVTFVVAAITWFAVRPALSIALLAAALGTWFLLKSRKSKNPSPAGYTPAPVSPGGYASVNHGAAPGGAAPPPYQQ